MKMPLKMSLKIKFVLMVLVFTTLLSGSTVVVSYFTYTKAFEKHYTKLAASISDATASVVDKEQVKRVASEVLRTYGSVCEEEGGEIDFSGFSDEDWENYYSRFSYVMEMQEYKELLEVLSRLRTDYGVVSLYLGYTDTNTMKDLYLVDASEPGENCIPGDLDDVQEEHIPQIQAGNYEFPAFITNYEEYGWLCSASAPILDKDGAVIGVALVDISMNEIVQNRNQFLLTLILIIAVVALFMILLVLALTEKMMLKPLDRLSKAAGMFVSQKQNDSETSAISSLEIHTGDEIENLSESIKKMEQEINRYISNLTAVTAEKERIGAELDVAAKIQADMLPCIFPAFPDRHEFDIYATMTPAKEVGGDFYDFFLVDDDHLAMVMADVSGKGVPAALFMMISKTLIKSAAQSGLSPKAVLEKVNNQLCENNEAEMFVTVWLGIMEISTGIMKCANAGHEYPAIKRKNGAFELFKDKHGFVLAGMEGSRYREYEITLEPGDSIFVYTDGVAEATNMQNELFGTERMTAALNQKEVRCEELLHLVHKAVDTFAGAAPQFDDITMLCLKMGEGDHMKKKSILPQLEKLDEATAFFEEIMEEAEVPMKVISQVNIAVDEIFSNIARYSGASSAILGCETEGNRIKIRFSDNGRPYDPTKNTDPDVTLSAEDREIGGLGIFMVKKMMEQVNYEYSDGFNVLTLEKSW